MSGESWFYLVAVTLAAVAGLYLAATAAAQSYPVKPVRMVIPFAPGGNTDIIDRIFVPEMSEFLGQQIIVDNRSGAGGTPGQHDAFNKAKIAK